MVSRSAPHQVEPKRELTHTSNGYGACISPQQRKIKRRDASHGRGTGQRKNDEKKLASKTYVLPSICANYTYRVPKKFNTANYSKQLAHSTQSPILTGWHFLSPSMLFTPQRVSVDYEYRFDEGTDPLFIYENLGVEPIRISK